MFNDPSGEAIGLAITAAVVAAVAVVGYMAWVNILNSPEGQIAVNNISDKISDAFDDMEDAAESLTANIFEGLVDLRMNEFEIFMKGVIIVSDSISFYKEHTSNKSPSKRNKHEEGQTRKKMDKGGEKGDARRWARKDSRK